MNTSFRDKVVIITGSSMGIGKALAKLVGSQGARVVLNARNAEKLKATEEILKKAGCEVFSFIGDITNQETCKKLIGETIARYGRIDVLVNNAGVSMRGGFKDLKPSVIEQIYNVNTIAPLMLTQLALPHITASKGSIIFISSLAAFRGLPSLSVYASAKMALTSIAETLRIEHRHDGVHIGIVYVGYTEVEKGKTTINADGTPVELGERKGGFSETIDTVAKKIARNISRRRKRTVIGVPGKFYAFLVRYFPATLELMVHRSYRKMKDLYK